MVKKKLNALDRYSGAQSLIFPLILSKQSARTCRALEVLSAPNEYTQHIGHFMLIIAITAHTPVAVETADRPTTHSGAPLKPVSWSFQERKL